MPYLGDVRCNLLIVGDDIHLASGSHQGPVAGANLVHRIIVITHHPEFLQKQRRCFMRFRKRPVEIEAIQWNGANSEEVYGFIGSPIRVDYPKKKVRISTLEGDMWASEGDWIIKGVQGECYPCKPDIFEATYDPV